MEFNYNNNIYPVLIIRKNNKNIYIRVKDSTITVTCNKLVTKKKISSLLDSNYNSIVKMIENDNKRKIKEERFYYLGREYNIIYGFSDTFIEDDKIYTYDNKSLNKYLDNIIKDLFYERLMYWYNIYEEDIPIPNLKIRKMTSRWGVCNIRNHNVTLNYYLYRYNLECLDYVIVHELSHFIHPNHSKLFWNQVSKYCPNYKELRNKLKE